MHVWLATTYKDGHRLRAAVFSSKKAAMKWVEFNIRANVDWSPHEDGETRVVAQGFEFRDPPSSDPPPAIVERVEVKDEQSFRRRWSLASGD